MGLKKKGIVLLTAALVTAFPVQAAAQVTYYNYGSTRDEDEWDTWDEDEDTEYGPGASTAPSVEIEEETSSVPGVKEVTLTEQYHEEYGTYEESMVGLFFIYSNVGNGGFSDSPVYVDIPANLTWTMEKDGIPMAYSSGQMVGEKGTYVLRLSGIDDPQLPFSQQTEYKAVFRFRIQEKLPVKETEAETAGSFAVSQDAAAFYEGTGTEVSGQNSAPDPSLAGETESASLPEETEPETDGQENEETEAVPEETPAVESGEEERIGGLIQSYEMASRRYSFTTAAGTVFSANIPEGMKGCRNATLYLEEGAEYTLYRNGQQLEYVSGDHLEETGDYRLETGGSAFHFTVGAFLRQENLYTAPMGMKISRIVFSGKEMAVENDRYAWFWDDGIYEISLTGEAGASMEYSLTKDSVSPEAAISLTKSKASIAYRSEDIAEVTLEKDGGEPQGFRGTEISSPGNYRLTVTDQAGNTSTYDFSLKFQMNFYAVFAIILFVVLAAGGVFFVRHVKKNMKVR